MKNKKYEVKMKKSMLLYTLAAMLVFTTACNKDDETTTTADLGTTGPTFTGINKVNVNTNGSTHEFVFADGINPTTEYTAFATKQTEDNFVYTEIIMGATDHFEHISTAALIINFFGEGTGSQNISYGLADSSNLFNFSGSMFTLVSDTASFPTMYFFEQATANITSYGAVGEYIEGTFESTEVSLAGIPQPDVTITGNFKVKRFESKK